MSCLAEERFVELLDQGGLDATKPEEQAHLETCESCRDSWATIAAAGEVLVEARPRSASRASRLIPMIAAAAMLLTIIGVVALKKIPSTTKPMQDPLAMFLEGNPEESRRGAEALKKSGRKSLPGLVAARPKLKGSARFQALQDLIWDIKLAAAAQDPAESAIFRKLETMKIDLAFENTRVEDILAFVRDFSGLNLVLDPTVDAGIVDKYSVKDFSLRASLEVLCAVKELDFDLRYGVVFFSRPLRLWSTDPAVGLPASNEWTKQILSPPDAGIPEKLRLVRITIDMQNSPYSAIADYLKEITGVTFKVGKGISETPVTLKVQDLYLRQALELLTLPYGREIRIEEGSVLIYDPKSK